jgi:hypothetical protein
VSFLVYSRFGTRENFPSPTVATHYTGSRVSMPVSLYFIYGYHAIQWDELIILVNNKKIRKNLPVKLVHLFLGKL